MKKIRRRAKAIDSFRRAHEVFEGRSINPRRGTGQRERQKNPSRRLDVERREKTCSSKKKNEETGVCRKKAPSRGEKGELGCRFDDSEAKKRGLSKKPRERQGGEVK